MVTRQRFVHWIEAHHQALYRHAMWMVGETELAADLVQETYYQAWRGRAGLRDESKAFAWLLTILRRGIFHEYGRASRQRAYLQELNTDEAGAADDGLIDLARAFARLNPAQRDLILLNALHGLSYAEISAQLDIPIGTVMSRLARARKELAQTLQVEPQGGNVIPLHRVRIL